MRTCRCQYKLQSSSSRACIAEKLATFAVKSERTVGRDVVSTHSTVVQQRTSWLNSTKLKKLIVIQLAGNPSIMHYCTYANKLLLLRCFNLGAARHSRNVQAYDLLH